MGVDKKKNMPIPESPDPRILLLEKEGVPKNEVTPKNWTV